MIKKKVQTKKKMEKRNIDPQMLRKKALEIDFITFKDIIRLCHISKPAYLVM